MQNDDYGPHRAFGVEAHERGCYSNKFLHHDFFNTKEGAEKFIKQFGDDDWVYSVVEVTYHKDY